MTTLMAANHVAEKGTKPDLIFAIAKAASDAVAEVGKDKVVNASLGVIYDEQEKFASFISVENYIKHLPADDLMNYAPIGGLPEFLNAAMEMVFQGNMPENTYAQAVATPGGTGAIRHVFYNYSEPGQKILVPNLFWGSYRTIAREHHRNIDTYPLFDENFNFNVNGIKDKVRALLKEQDNLVIVFNTPGHNPTGHTISEPDWIQLIDFFKDCAQDKQKRITLLLDIAYIDFSGNPAESRKFFRLFSELPKNILITVAYSMSKSFLIYGMRSGALIGLSSDPEIVAELALANTNSNRGVWSNGTRAAQRLLADVVGSPELRASIAEERIRLREILQKRAEIFLEEADQVGLKLYPYHGGFFITVPASDPAGVAQRLTNDHIFVVNMDQSLRVAICGIPTHKVLGVAGKIKKAF